MDMKRRHGDNRNLNKESLAAMFTVILTFLLGGYIVWTICDNLHEEATVCLEESK